MRATTTLILGFLIGLVVALPIQAQGERDWPNETKGTPVFRAGMALGYFIWTENDGVQVRWTTNGRTHRFSGRMTTRGQITTFRRVGIERGDSVRRIGNAVAWDAQNTGFTDGFSFSVSRSADWVLFTLNIDGQAARGDQIFIGNRGHHPAGPVVLRRLGMESGWPPIVRGRPSFEVGENLGYFLWRDADGWHLRWTTRGRTRVFAGTVSTNGLLHDWRRVAMEGGDLTVRGTNVIAWRSGNSGHLDGFDFRTTGDRLTFTLLLDGSFVPARQIFVGAGGSRPSANPFTLVR